MAERLVNDVDWLNEATDIAYRLRKEAVSTDSGIRWIADDLHGDTPESAVVIRGESGVGLYSGSSGIGWFLAHLGNHTGDKELKDFGVQAIMDALHFSQQSLTASSLSLYGGASGVALSALQVGEDIGDQSLTIQARKLALEVASCLMDAEIPMEMDLIGGVAGIVVSLVEFQRRSPSVLISSACTKVGKQIERYALSHWQGIHWKDLHFNPDSVGLCGMAHGVSGIAWALFLLEEVSQEADWNALAMEALRYEKAWFSVANATWADLRGDPNADGWPGNMTAWCHGGIGIAALRLWLLDRLKQPDDYRAMPLLADLGAALHSLRPLVAGAKRQLDLGIPVDVTLCHGIGGAAELFTLAYAHTSLMEHKRAALFTASLCVDCKRVNCGAYTNGVPGAKRVPGLMTGDAGIGAMLMRIHSPKISGSPLLAGC